MVFSEGKTRLQLHIQIKIITSTSTWSPLTLS